MQTARGTPLTGDSDPAPVDEARADLSFDREAVGSARADRPVRSLLPFLIAIAAVVLALDQISKAVAVDRLSEHPPVELLGGFLTLRLVRNAGAAFGLATGFTVLFTLFAVVVAVVVVRVARRLRNRVWAVALAMLLGGAVGNLSDRIFRDPGAFRGHVVDFLELPHWPVFNLADSSIVCAGVLLVLLTFRGVPYDR